MKNHTKLLYPLISGQNVSKFNRNNANKSILYLLSSFVSYIFQCCLNVDNFNKHNNNKKGEKETSWYCYFIAYTVT